MIPFIEDLKWSVLLMLIAFKRLQIVKPINAEWIRSAIFETLWKFNVLIFFLYSDKLSGSLHLRTFPSDVLLL